MRENTLFLHMGVPKTGTTSLQNFLYENEELLNSNGFSYPHVLEELVDLPFSREHIKKNGAMFYGYLDENKENDVYWREFCNYLHSCLEEYNIIVSAEGMINEWERILSKIEGEFYDIKVIVYLRRQDELIESLWNQNIKAGDTSRSFEEYVAVAPIWLDYDNTLNRMIRVLGADRVIVRNYNRLLDGSIEIDFMTSIGIEYERITKVNSDILNIKMSDRFLSFKRLFNEVGLQCEGYISKDFRYVFEELSKNYPDYERANYFKGDSRSCFQNKYLDGNIKVGEKFFSDENSLVWKKNNEETCEPELESKKQTISDKIQNAIMCFTAVSIELDRKISLLEEDIAKLQSITEKQIGIIGEERGLLLLGAGKYCKRIIQKKKYNITGVYDNDDNKVGSEFNGFIIKPARDLNNRKKEMVVIATSDTVSIERQLESYGLKKDKDYVLGKEYFPSVYNNHSGGRIWN